MRLVLETLCQVITDNGTNCVSMGHMLEEGFPNIVWSLCVVHSLDLMIEDIGKLDWVSRLFCCNQEAQGFEHVEVK